MFLHNYGDVQTLKLCCILYNNRNVMIMLYSIDNNKNVMIMLYSIYNNKCTKV